MTTDTQTIEIVPGISAALRDSVGDMAYMTSADGDVLIDVDYALDYYSEEDFHEEIWKLIEDCSANYLLLFK